MRSPVNGVFDVDVPVVLVITVTVVSLVGGLVVRDDVDVPNDSN